MKKQFKISGILSLICIFFIYGFLVGKNKIFPYRFVKGIYYKILIKDTDQKTSKTYYGRWEKLRAVQEPKDDKIDEALKKISALPYLKGYKLAKDKLSGVTYYDSTKAYTGVTLFCSGHKPIVYLMDMKGNVLHKWSTQFKTVWPDTLPFLVHSEHKQFIRRARVYPNGDIVCVFAYVGLVKFDKNSNILWKFTGLNHHDIDISEDNYIYSLGHTFDNIQDKYPDFKYKGRDDFIIILNSEGKQIKKISIFDAFYNSDFASFLDLIHQPDLFHANSVEIVNKSITRKYDMFKEGDALVSMRGINSIAVIDVETSQVKWALTGMWHMQHQSIFLENGNIMLFDNRGGNKESFFKFNQSKIIEFDPLTQKVYWQYRGEGQKRFFSHWLGYNQRLPNGNTLITESTQGRIFEVTPENEIVWEYYNPHRTGEENELIATVMGARRLNGKKLIFLEN